MSAEVVVSAAVEGIVDEAVVRRLLSHVHAIPGEVHGKNGKSHLRKRMGGYNNAARYAPWIVLVDLDREADCPPPMRFAWVPEPARSMCFRVAVRAIEAWLLGDRERLASFLSIGLRRLPGTPESLEDPKRTIVDLSRQSRRRGIREDMVPRPGSGRSIGPAYSSRLIEFTENHWRPEVADGKCESLRRAIESLRCLCTPERQ